jgi:hypothetical protein
MTREIRLQDIRDVVEFNGFWATKPSRVWLTYEEEQHTGLWQLILRDMESSRVWRFGAYIDGHEGRRTLYHLPLKYSYGVYVEDDPNYDVKNHVIEHDDDFVIRLPDEWRPDVIIKIKAVCGVGYPLAEPVWLGLLPNGDFFALDCAGGLYRFSAFEELENWIREQECPEGHQHPTIHWWEWHIVRNGGVVHSEYVQPSPEEVINALRRHLL